MTRDDAKLSDEEVAQIRQELKQPGVKIKDIAEAHGVSGAFISQVKSGQRRKEGVHRVKLRSGGEVVITSQVDLFSLDAKDMAFVMQLLEFVKRYEEQEG